MTRIALLLLMFALAGCGNKGPLVLASPPPAAVEQPPADTQAPQPSTEEPAPTIPVPVSSGTPAR